ncbi:hypothetical protein Spirs_2820 [Sediminispirochaeta smaragdinae DSM 11293]|uniref:Uncharacterized protein n=1 Tax=Sediminispirochaeta smaragdinae (strain DSM 11293 / JCM 15392 / SEBR 4228) TaxID=573413 RepID=E1R238_SEDSS|nr:hypothetical protein Spirs_2820 [Sediminispirochaeta smaragdinae DSM 11293]
MGHFVGYLHEIHVDKGSYMQFLFWLKIYEKEPAVHGLR